MKVSNDYYRRRGTAWVALRGGDCLKPERSDGTAERIARFKSGAEVLTEDDVADMRERARKWRFR